MRRQALAYQARRIDRCIRRSRLHRQGVDRVLPELAHAPAAKLRKLHVGQVSQPQCGTVRPGDVPAARREQIRIINDRLADADRPRIHPREEGIDPQRCQRAAGVVGETDLVTACGSKCQGFAQTRPRRHVRHGDDHVDLVDQIIQRNRVPIDVDLIGGAGPRLLVSDVDEEAAVLDRERESGTGSIKILGGVVHAIRPLDRFKAHAPLALRMQSVELEDQLPGKGIKGLDRRLDRRLALVQQTTDPPGADLQIASVGRDAN